MENGTALLYIHGEEMPFNFQLDPTKNPMELDFIKTEPDGEQRRLLTIIKFTSQKQIIIRTLFTDERPTRFVEEGEDEMPMMLEKVD